MYDYYTAGMVGQSRVEQYLKDAAKDRLAKEAEETNSKTLKEKKEKPAKTSFLAFRGQ